VELFEILFILFFILIPVLEGIRKSRQRGRSQDVELPGGAPGRPGRPGPASAPRRMPQESVPAPAPSPLPRREPDPVEASDMIPDDLWEILTGERRQRPGPPGPEPMEVEEIGSDTRDERWLEEPDQRWREEPEESWRAEAEQTWRDEPVSLEPPAPIREPIVATPTLSRFDPGRAPARRLRTPLREVVEAPPVVRTVSPLMRMLQSPRGLRDAVLLREILGPPKGLD
jgi:hypothetical protein